MKKLIIPIFVAFGLFGVFSVFKQLRSQQVEARSLESSYLSDTVSAQGGLTEAGSPSAQSDSVRAIPTQNDKEEDLNFQTQMKANWFVTPEFSGEKTYQAAHVEVQWNENCKSNPAFGKNDLVTLLKTEGGLSGEQQFPHTMHVVEISQFWKKSGQFFQISATWNSTYPPTYKIEYYSASNSEMGPSPEPVAMAQKMESVDIESALQFIEKELTSAKQKGAIEGARILQVQAAPPKSEADKNWHNVVYLNGTPAQYARGSLTCNTDLANTAKGVCRCE